MSAFSCDLTVPLTEHLLSAPQIIISLENTSAFILTASFEHLLDGQDVVVRHEKEYYNI